MPRGQMAGIVLPERSATGSEDTMARFESTTVDGRRMRIMTDGPSGGGQHPAVLLAFHREGFSPFTADVVAQFAAAGYAIAVPDQFHRLGDDAPWREGVKHRRDDHVLADMRAGLDWLGARADVDAGRIVLAGHCMGGRVVFLVAGTMPAAFRACLTYYSGGTFAPWGQGAAPFALAKNIACPVAGFFGNDDDNPSPADVDRIDAELTRAGVPHDFHRYDGAGHGYMYKATGNWRAAAATDSWRRSFAFLAHLGLAPGLAPGARAPASTG